MEMSIPIAAAVDSLCKARIMNIQGWKLFSTHSVGWLLLHR